VIVAIPVLVTLVLVILIPESPRYLVVSGQKDKATETMKTLFRWNGKEFPDNTTIKTYQNVERGKIGDLTKPKYLKDTVLISLMYVPNIVIIFGLIIFLPLALSSGFCGVADKKPPAHDCKTLDQVNLRDLTIITSSAIVAVVVSVAVAKKLGRNCPLKVFGVCIFLSTLSLYICINLTLTKLALFLTKFFVHTSNSVLW